MKTEMQIIQPDGTITSRLVELALEPEYETLRAILDPVFHAQRSGAWFEHVSVLHNGGRRDMFVDDEGMLYNQPINKKATAIYHAAAIARGDKPRGFIHGVAVLFPERQVWF